MVSGDSAPVSQPVRERSTLDWAQLACWALALAYVTAFWIALDSRGQGSPMSGDWEAATNVPEEIAAPAPGEAVVCLACGRPLHEIVRYTGSLRCPSCRETEAPLDPALVHAWHQTGAPY